MPLIREYRQEDVPALEECIVELQEFERKIESNRRKGTSVSQKYLEKVLKNCKQQSGNIFVAEENGKVVGFCSVWLEKKPEELISTLKEYAYISDCILLPDFRRKGLGKSLLNAAEKHAIKTGMKTIIVGVLAKNTGAIEVYKKAGFEDYEMLLRKKV